ncbi:hypothetical protein PVAP13_8KG201701 [Panicum virgatum]|uniref:Ubiquitin-like protease family profile domain-containing protein n=1 Tax=Panicum virgatum TaxID=38727 RepID=A0A8T0PGT7_PANVG|nr:hypothetical protein PVAP13_8KG201701 [Panicum virgatum]
MEQDLMDRGIRPMTWDWLYRSKWWLFANGVTLNQLDGNLVMPEHMQEVSRDLVAAIDETQQGTFYPQRENDELTRALKNPVHPGRARGIGVVPWKVAGAGDSSYKTHQKSKAEQEEKLRAMQEEMTRKVASLESQMDARRRSSCASTAAPDVQAEQQPQIEPTAKTLGDALHGVVLWRKADIKLTASTTAPVQTDRPSPRSPSPLSPQPPPSPPSPPAQRATSTPTPPDPEKGKKKTASGLLADGPSKKNQKMVERKLTYEKTAEELEEETAQYIKEQLKPKVPPPREKVPLEQGKKLLANLDNPPKPKSLASDYDRTLTKAHKAAIFLSETGLTLEEATGQVEAEIPVAPVLTPFQHGKPFVTEEEEKSLGTQMFNLHRWYLRMSKDHGKMFGVNYHWILLILSVETGNLIVFDSMRNPKSAIQHIIDPLNRVWKKFVRNNKGRGQWRPKLNVNMDYPCARQQQGTDWCRYYVCDYLHIMTPCGKVTDEDTGMSQMADECYSTDRIIAVCEQLAGFILNEILDPRGEFYHDGHIYRGLPSTS